MNSYNLIVIGAGPGGYVAAIKAASLGQKVALIEQNQIGGTCLNRGCIPTKTLIHSCELMKELSNSSELGILVNELKFDLNALFKRKDNIVASLRNGINSLLESNHIDCIQGKASFVSPNEIKVDDDYYFGEKILIATGSLPSKPPITGITLKGVITSDDLLTKASPYKSLLIIGGGVIAVEFASIYNTLGCNVTIIEAMERILPNMDREISQNLSLILKKQGVTIHTGARIECIEHIKNQTKCHVNYLFEEHSSSLKCYFTKKEEHIEVEAESILVATGRIANTKGLGLESIGLTTTNGQINVNGAFETSIPNIYAIGDVIYGSSNLAHVASAQGINAVCTMFSKDAPHNLSAIPACIYTSPEIATVGISADEAKQGGILIKQGKAMMFGNGKSIIERADRGFIKLVFDSETEVLLGAQLMCTRATDLISELTTAVANRLTAKELLSTIRPHPTFSESITEAIQDAFGTAIHSLPKHR